VSLRLGQRPPTTQLRRRVWEPTARFELATCQGYLLAITKSEQIREDGKDYSRGPVRHHLPLGMADEGVGAEAGPRGRGVSWSGHGTAPPGAFGSDDYQVMIVGEKFQTEMGQVAAIIATTEEAQGPGIKAHGAIYSTLDPAMERFRVRA